MSELVSCPYPGLRPFNENEAIFFKGREEHIEQIIKQLEEKKFLMLTGASGDGKSSLVYAGVIPNARAGFFKAKFNNWLIADFRPERQPLKNISDSLSRLLKIDDSTKTEKELSYGFSALIDLYKSSPYWVDQESSGYLSLPEKDKMKTKKKGANLMILVDQFEEFFTNPENYSAGKASIESQTVVNLLLETTRLALEQDIPIYIICTMRSDYVGQCAAFRGLPEYIGYSQFFVPRLKRKEIYQVIEEPALLNGNKISKRLVDMLINEMNDGIDQLPVLQHALNQIWQIADKGMAEMDIIHFAMAGGISASQLPNEQKIKFEEWFSTIPNTRRKYYESPSLQNIIDLHANALLDSACAHFKKLSGNEISNEETLRIVTTVFKCLTKIDSGRAIRNRMTLEEIQNVFNDSGIETNKISAVITIFRLEGNNFIRPFLPTETNSVDTTKNLPLDITHESLIRNWGLLRGWAIEEENDIQNFLELEKQVKRWATDDNKQIFLSNRRSNFLLSKGPYEYFNQWFVQFKPTAQWLVKYDLNDDEAPVKILNAQKRIDDTRLYLVKSGKVFKRKRQIVVGLISLFFIAAVSFLYIKKIRAEEEMKKAENFADTKIDKFDAKVIAPSSYIMQGGKYIADVFAVARSSKLGDEIATQIFLGKLDSNGNIIDIYDTLKMNEGFGKIEVEGKIPGEHKIEGVVQVKSPSGKINNATFSQSYMVAAPSANIEIKSMNNLFVGMSNEVVLNVPGCAPGDIMLNVSGCGATLSPKAPGEYIIKVRETGEVKINTSIKTQGGYLALEPIVLKSKKLPLPNAYFMGKTGSTNLGTLDLNQSLKLDAKSDNSDFDLKFKIKSFEMMIVGKSSNTQFKSSSGDALTKEMVTELLSASLGDKIIFRNIIAYAPDGSFLNLDPIILELGKKRIRATF
ncbi:MAG: GldM family protein [Bacteroidota bacterium]|jgi:energy-coupling factor transporter ATP-binding protein EcfA2